jgi:hypothetical protein
VGLSFDDLPLGVDFVESPSSSDGFYPYQHIASSIEICYNRFCNTLMLGREEKRQNIQDEQACETGY